MRRRSGCRSAVGDLSAVLGELLANAVKYADEGGSGAEGYGLGLSIARRRAEALGGSISCESDPAASRPSPSSSQRGRGSVFRPRESSRPNQLMTFIYLIYLLTQHTT